MDAVVRGRRRLLIAAGAFAATIATLACGASSKSAGGVVGASDRSAGATRGEALDAGLRDGSAALPAGYRSTFKKLNRARLVAAGHAAGRWEVDVWVNEAAEKALAARSKDVPVGALVVEEHYERGEGKAAGPVMVMEKREKGYAPEHGDWRWAVIGASGALVRDGVVEQCAGCHDDAPMDGLFPIVAE